VLGYALGWIEIDAFGDHDDLAGWFNGAGGKHSARLDRRSGCEQQQGISHERQPVRQFVFECHGVTPPLSPRNEPGRRIDEFVDRWRPGGRGEDGSR
jgi:hypothetical protein